MGVGRSGSSLFFGAGFVDVGGFYQGELTIHVNKEGVTPEMEAA